MPLPTATCPLTGPLIVARTSVRRSLSLLMAFDPSCARCSSSVAKSIGPWRDRPHCVWSRSYLDGCLRIVATIRTRCDQRVRCRALRANRYAVLLITQSYGTDTLVDPGACCAGDQIAQSRRLSRLIVDCKETNDVRHNPCAARISGDWKGPPASAPAVPKHAVNHVGASIH